MEDYIIYNDLLGAYHNEYNMYQEGLIDEAKAIDKKESKFIKILKFIPRLIMAIVRRIKQFVFDKVTNMKMKRIESHLKQSTDSVTESFYIETPVFYGFDKDVKQLHKHSGEFNEFTHKLYDDCGEMMFNVRGLINAKGKDSIATNANKFSREWNISKTYMSFMSGIAKWSERLLKYNTNKDSHEFFIWDGKDNKLNNHRLMNAFNYVCDIRNNLNESTKNLDKTSELMWKNQPETWVATVDNRVSQLISNMVDDIFRSCKCLSVVANKLAEITKRTIDDMYKCINEEGET